MPHPAIEIDGRITAVISLNAVSRELHLDLVCQCGPYIMCSTTWSPLYDFAPMLNN